MVQDSSHVLWNCPVINPLRKLRELSSLDPSVIPLCIRNGIPAALSGKLADTFWGAQCESCWPNNNSTSTLTACGMPPNRMAQNIAESKDEIIKKLHNDGPHEGVDIYIYIKRQKNI